MPRETEAVYVMAATHCVAHLSPTKRGSEHSAELRTFLFALSAPSHGACQLYMHLIDLTHILISYRWYI